MEGGDASPGAGTRFALEQDEYKETVAELIAKAERVTISFSLFYFWLQVDVC